MNNKFVVNRCIVSLEEIINEITNDITIVECINKGLKSLKGIERMPSVTKLSVGNNEITSLEWLKYSNVKELYIRSNKITSLNGLCGSKITFLYIRNNKIESFEGINGSNLEELYISHNPCYEEFAKKFNFSVEKVKEEYEPDIKDPGLDY